MSSKSKIEIQIATILQGRENVPGLKDDLRALGKEMAAVQSQSKTMGRVNFAAMMVGFDQVRKGFEEVSAICSDVTAAYSVQREAETKLETVMRQRMGATEEEIQSIKDLASAQQELGVIGDEVQLAGAQQIATFLTQKDTLATLLPAMNNLVAQQKGLGATGSDAVAIGNLLGKAMQGQVSALKRVGITFSEAEANVMKYGTEEQRAAMLARIITNNVGEMNAALAQTDAGKMQQQANAFGDYKEVIGSWVAAAQPYIVSASALVTVITSLGQAVAGCTAFVKGLWTITLAASKATWGFIASAARATASTLAWNGATMTNLRTQTIFAAALLRQKVAAAGLALVQKTVAVATGIWAGAQKVLNLVLSLNPIGVVIMAITGLVTAITIAYNKSETFRAVCDKVWGSVKGLAKVIMDNLVKALQWIADKCKVVWDWLSNIFSLGGKEIKVKATVSTENKGAEIPNVEAPGKDAGKISSPKISTPKITAAQEEAKGLIAQIEADIDEARKRLASAVTEEGIASINAEITAMEAELDRLNNLGKGDSTALNEKASTIEEITANLTILNDRLQKASADEAAAINQQISAWREKEDAIRNAGTSVVPTLNAEASTLSEITANVDILNERLQNATQAEAIAINQEIALWERKADAIRNAGKEQEKQLTLSGQMGNAVSSLGDKWNNLKSMGSSIRSITDALSGNKSLWEQITGVVDGVLSLFQSFSGIIGIFEQLTAATQAKSAADMASVGPATAAATADMTAAAAGTFKAHSSIPFVGIAMAAASVAAMIAMLTSLPKLADGGVAFGPTMALVGEYSGASSNPEVIAPLNKLRSLLQPTEGVVSGDVKFYISGDALEGVLRKHNRKLSRT